MMDRRQVGTVQFEIEAPRPIRWKPEDGGFVCGGAAGRICCVRVTEADAVMEPGEPVYTEPGFSVFRQSDGTEIRTCRAAFLGQKVPYARSICTPDGVEIEFVTASGVWENPNFSFWSLLHLENHLLDAGGLILHCCYLMHDGGAILFTAPSGTGKTTQGKLWERVYGAEIINGDRALLQRDPGGWLAMGYPFHGSAPECRNESCPVRGIVVVRQAEEDRVERLSPAEAMILLYEGITVNVWDRQRSTQALDLLQELITAVPVVRLNCTMRESAAETLHRYFYGG